MRSITCIAMTKARNAVRFPLSAVVRMFGLHPALIYQGLRFALTGLSSYLFYVFLFFALSHVFGEYTALILAYVTATAAHFVASKYFTFLGKSRANLLPELLRFVVLLCVATLLNWATFYCARTVLGLDVSIALVVGILACSALSFIAMRAWVFAKK